MLQIQKAPRWLTSSLLDRGKRIHPPAHLVSLACVLGGRSVGRRAEVRSSPLTARVALTSPARLIIASARLAWQDRQMYVLVPTSTALARHAPDGSARSVLWFCGST